MRSLYVFALFHYFVSIQDLVTREKQKLCKYFSATQGYFLPPGQNLASAICLYISESTTICGMISKSFLLLSLSSKVS